ncbi:MAG: exodeoxyribonuclease VII large subunit [Candidatus Dadabacteria bacterium]|nr:exodeoxyribonuclease VII large subunit [Candidatus Dadabacteria bacterium]
MDRRIYRVSEINSSIKEAVEFEFGGETVWVTGEISGFKGHYASGHWYFSLKDDQSQISAACFRGSNQQIKFTPENGMDVICAARVGVYEKSGIYQLYVSDMEPRGVGADALALEKLKQKLLEEGLFEASKKRPLPFLSHKIGVVTSPSGAAVRDIIKVVYRRSPNVEVVISPASVQGDNAPAEIIEALDRLYSIDGLDLVIVTRGGGSKEDLKAFNDEAVSRKIVASPFPVISAVGHEVDVTIADLVSDVRAATPSMAAELAVREKREIADNLEQLRHRLSRSLTNRMDMFSMQLDGLSNSFSHHMISRIQNLEQRIENYSGKLASLNPFSVLERGYAIVSKQRSEEIVQDSCTLSPSEKLVLKLSRGKAFCSVERTDNESQG